MATGDLNDFRSRIKATLPRWFADSSPILDAVLSGVAQALSFVYSLYLYAQMQTRIKTATDGWLDLIAGDYFGTRIARKANQTDASFRAIIIANLFRERATRKALIQVLTDLTGRAPVLIEPQQPGDTGAYGGTDAITISGTPQVYRNDWQGNQLLYPTPRANTTIFSEQLDNAVWAKTGASVTVNSVLAPDGNLTADKVVETALSQRHECSNLTATPASGRVCFSFFARAAGRQFITSNRAGTSTLGATFDLVNGVVTAVGSSTLSASITSVGAGWFRCTYVYQAAGAFSHLCCLRTNGTGIAVETYTGDGVSGLYLWGAQVEIDGPGAGATSYIPTTTAAVTTTDYTIDSAGNIVFAQAPLPGAVLSWSGSYLNARTSQTVTVSGLTFANGDGYSTAFSVAPKYGYPCGYGVAGYYGSQLLPSQMFLIAYRPASAGIPNIAGYGNPQGAYRAPPVSMYGSLSLIQGQVTDADILAAIDSVKPVGTVIWTTIQS